MRFLYSCIGMELLHIGQYLWPSQNNYVWLKFFHKYELLLPPELTLNTDSSKLPRHRNLVREMDVNFKIIVKRWTKRREEQLDQTYKDDSKYPFTFMIDCLIEECKLNSNVTKFLAGKIDSKDEEIKSFLVFLALKRRVNFDAFKRRVA